MDSKPIEEKTATPTGLTNREVEVVQIYTKGGTKGDCARRLQISEGTCRKHLENIYRKWGISNRLELIERAKNLGLLY